MKTKNTSAVATVAAIVATVIATLTGKKGVATISRSGEKGPRSIELVIKGKDPVTMDASTVDVRSMGAENLEAALQIAVDSPSKLQTFTVSEIRGKKALVRTYRNEKNGNGYIVLIRKGAKNFTVALNRVDLAAMKSETIEEAVSKAAWVTGSIAPVKDAASAEAPAEAAAAQS